MAAESGLRDRIDPMGVAYVGVEKGLCEARKCSVVVSVVSITDVYRSAQEETRNQENELER